MIRSFLAVELPETILAKIGEIEGDLRKTSADVRWVSPEKIHLTLKFFGSIEESRIDPIMKAIEGPIRSVRPFQLSVQGMGVFPHFKSPKVIWMGLVDGEGVLASLQRQVEAALEKIGFQPEDRSFRPHLTLGRAKSNRGKEDLVQKMEGYRETFIGAFQVEKVTLFKSDLKPTGPVYTALREMRLGGSS